MLEVNNITKKYGDLVAVNSVSFKVGKGEIFGLLGENGAGKTTTLRMLATMIKPFSGSATIEGFDVVKQPGKVRGTIGILFGGETGLYDRLSARENIEYFGMLNGMDKKSVTERVYKLSKIFEMEEYIERRAAKLSKGMKQKVSFARSIVHDPDLMLFDEPTSGLDVGAVKNVHDFIKKCREEEKTVIFSSHSMSEVEKLCDRIGVIHKGTMIEIGTVDSFKKKYNSEDFEEVFLKMIGDCDEN